MWGHHITDVIWQRFLILCNDLFNWCSYPINLMFNRKGTKHRSWFIALETLLRLSARFVSLNIKPVTNTRCRMLVDYFAAGSNSQSIRQACESVTACLIKLLHDCWRFEVLRISIILRYRVMFIRFSGKKSSPLRIFNVMSVDWNFDHPHNETSTSG